MNTKIMNITDMVNEIKNIHEQHQDFKSFTKHLSLFRESLMKPNYQVEDEDIIKLMEKNNLELGFLNWLKPNISYHDLLNLFYSDDQDFIQSSFLYQQQLDQLEFIINISKKHFNSQNAPYIYQYLVNKLCNLENETFDEKQINKDCQWIKHANILESKLDPLNCFNSPYPLEKIYAIHHYVISYLKSLNEQEFNELVNKHQLTPKQITNLKTNLTKDKSAFKATDNELSIGKMYVNGNNNNSSQLSQSLLKQLSTTVLNYDKYSDLLNSDQKLKKEYIDLFSIYYNLINTSQIKDDLNTSLNQRLLKEYQQKNKDVLIDYNGDLTQIYDQMVKSIKQHLLLNFDHNEICALMRSQDNIDEHTAQKLDVLGNKKRSDWTDQEQKMFQEQIIPALVKNTILNEDVNITSTNLKNIFNTKDNEIEILYNHQKFKLSKLKNHQSEHQILDNKNEIMNLFNLFNDTLNQHSQLLQDKNQEYNQKVQEFNQELGKKQQKLANSKWGTITNLAKNRMVFIPLMFVNINMAIGLIGCSFLFSYLRKVFHVQRHKLQYQTLQAQKDQMNQKLKDLKSENEIIKNNKYIIDLDDCQTPINKLDNSSKIINGVEYEKRKQLIKKSLKKQMNYNDLNELSIPLINLNSNLLDEDQKEFIIQYFLKSTRLDTKNELLGKIVQKYNADPSKSTKSKIMSVNKMANKISQKWLDSQNVNISYNQLPMNIFKSANEFEQYIRAVMNHQEIKPEWFNQGNFLNYFKTIDQNLANQLKYEHKEQIEHTFNTNFPKLTSLLTQWNDPQTDNKNIAKLLEYTNDQIKDPFNKIIFWREFYEAKLNSLNKDDLNNQNYLQFIDKCDDSLIVSKDTEIDLCANLFSFEYNNYSEYSAWFELFNAQAELNIRSSWQSLFKTRDDLVHEPEHKLSKKPKTKKYSFSMDF